MLYSTRLKCAAAIFGIATAAALAAPALASPPSGVTTTNFVTARLNDTIQVNNDRVKFQTKDATDVRVQRLTFAAGAYTGWHHHPGLVVVVVESGSLVLTDGNCGSRTYGPGRPTARCSLKGTNMPTLPPVPQGRLSMSPMLSRAPLLPHSGLKSQCRPARCRSGLYWGESSGAPQSNVSQIGTQSRIEE